jgi:prepilin-type N-terminal cleavage/methylation domain-containing protein
VASDHPRQNILPPSLQSALESLLATLLVAVTDRMSRKSRSSAGFSILEMLIVLIVLATISGYAIVTYSRTQANLARNDAALRFSIALEKAQHDSGKRRNAPVPQLGYVKVIDSKSYSLSVDANGDGVIDAPVLTTLPDVHKMRIKGPFPKYLRFDWLGRVIDKEGQVISPPLVTFETATGTSTVKVEPGGKPQIVYGEK